MCQQEKPLQLEAKQTSFMYSAIMRSFMVRSKPWSLWLFTNAIGRTFPTISYRRIKALENQKAKLAIGCKIPPTEHRVATIGNKLEKSTITPSRRPPGAVQQIFPHQQPATN